MKQTEMTMNMTKNNQEHDHEQNHKHDHEQNHEHDTNMTMNMTKNIFNPFKQTPT